MTDLFKDGYCKRDGRKTNAKRKTNLAHRTPENRYQMGCLGPTWIDEWELTVNKKPMYSVKCKNGEKNKRKKYLTQDQYTPFCE